MALRHCSEPSVGRRIWVNMAVSMGNPPPRYCAGPCASIVENASAAQHFGRYDDRTIAPSRCTVVRILTWQIAAYPRCHACR
ncbi:hypothetical protein C0Q88_14745 [Ralstonia pickettii]|uniref:Uncharacterized protein n=1 Tax=Ralstonia pickettii TaxID=329 RepID=A0A2N4TQ86_RALPI|nr:hypothetical protein C0Q88_14745 [Ralstonia pickettii]